MKTELLITLTNSGNYVEHDLPAVPPAGAIVAYSYVGIPGSEPPAAPVVMVTDRPLQLIGGGYSEPPSTYPEHDAYLFVAVGYTGPHLGRAEPPPTASYDVGWGGSLKVYVLDAGVGQVLLRLWIQPD